MRRSFLCVGLGLAVAACSDSQDPEELGPIPGCTTGAVAATGARYQICFPETWNGDLVVYAHGYVPRSDTLRIPDDEVEGQTVASLVNGLGYAYATTSYRANGLVVPEAVLDVSDLIDVVRTRVRPDPERTFVVGFSEGGLVAALVAERYANKVDGALAGCGPIGDFLRQIDHVGDVRVAFDYFFPGVLPGTAVDVPDAAIEGWSTQYVPAIAAALLNDQGKTQQLIAVTGLPVEAGNPISAGESVISALFYNIFGTMDARERLGGQPFDNTTRVYTGSADDEALNSGIARHAADPAARTRLEQAFQTTGALTMPLVTLHTTQDPDVPQFHQALHAEKVEAAGSTAMAFLAQATPARYGHCEFTLLELMWAFSLITQPQ